MNDYLHLRERGWWYEDTWQPCIRCGGDGRYIECYDDLCHADGRCMHGNNTCELCAGIGQISHDLADRWRTRDAFESVELPDADLHLRRDLHEVARERREGA
jgi:hypothetical protein